MNPPANVEGTIGIHHQSTILTLLDDDAPGAAFENPPGGPVNIPITREFPGLRIVDHQDVDALEEFE
jgi:hypothetical protein